jgi:glutathione S-transferase
MALEVYMHPLSSYSWQVLIALDELGAPYEARTVNLQDAAERAAYLQISPFGKIPALRDTARGVELIETSIIIDYLDQHYPGPVRLIPADRDAAREVRLWDRLFDLYVQDGFQPIVNNRLRPEGQRDAPGVEMAHAKLRSNYEVLERMLGGGTWAAGETFTMADCAAAPALFYADVLEPLDPGSKLAAYYRRLLERPSVARAIAGAGPYFHMFPATETERARLPKT